MDFKPSVGDTLTNASSLSLCFKISDPLTLEMILAHTIMINESVSLKYGSF